MSHTVQVKTEFKNVKTLTKALESLGWSVVQKRQIRTYDLDKTVYDCVALNPSTSGYDIGINVNGKNGLEVKCDLFGGSIEATLGSNLTKLKQKYAVQSVRDLYQYKNVIITVKDGQQGNTVITIQE